MNPTNTFTNTPYDLLNRYLQEIRKYLPESGDAARRQDILAELSANLLEQIEDREAELGRTLTADEVALILKQHGHPMRVAGRYLPQQYLIGPTMMPVYWYVLKLALSLALLLYAIVNAALLATSKITPEAVGQVLLHLPGVALTVFAWVTLIFAVLEFAVGRYRLRLGPLDNWEPGRLPKVQLNWQWSWGQRWRTLGEIVPGVLGVLYWLIAVPNHPFLMFGPGAAFLTFGPAIRAIYWPILALALVQLALDFVGARYDAQSWQRRAKGVAAKVVALGMMGLVWRAHDLLAAAPAVAHVEQFQRMAAMANSGLLVGIRIAFLMSAVLLVVDVVRLASIWVGKRMNP